MKNAKKVLVSTTSSLTGIEIKKYLKPVSAHIVAATDFFSDFAASISDIFGGRSKTYQNQIISIYNEAIEQLKEAAIRIGANAVIGLKVDLDEISGKGKSMFMITAVGTAVIVEETKGDSSVISSSKVALENLENLRRKKEILEGVKSKNLTLNDENWLFIISNQISEVFDYLVDRFKKEYEELDTSEHTQKLYKLISSFLNAFPDDAKTELLYGRIISEQNESIRTKLCELIETFNLLNFEYINKILDSNDFTLKKTATTLLTYNKQVYDKADIKEIDMIIEKIKTSFPETGTYATKKGFMSSREKEVWNCSCGRTNNEIGEKCFNCNKDIFGFTRQETTPAHIIELLEERKEMLDELINSIKSQL